MINKTNGISLTIMGLFIALLGVIAPIVWDLWNSSAEISLIIDHTATIIEKRDNVEKLVILYEGKQIESLSKTSFTLKNTGRKAVALDDIVSNPNIALRDGNIFEAEIIKSDPEYIDKNISTNGKSVSLTFKLLNPGDMIIFSILSDVKTPIFIPTARIKNIKNLKIIKAEEQIKINGNVGFWVYIVGLFSALFFAVFISLLMDAPKFKQQIAAIKNGETPLHKNESIEVIYFYIDKNLSMLTKEKRKRIKELIPKNVDKIDDSEAQKIISFISTLLSSENPIAGAITALLLAVIGGWYVYNSIFV